MKKTVSAIALIILCLSLRGWSNDNNVKDVNDPRGKMVPWEKGAWETGKYRNVFLEAGYKQEDIDAKLAQAYYALFEGPNKVYFEVGDSMGYVSDLKNHDARTEGLSYGMMVAVQLNKKDVFDRLWRWTVKYMQHQEGPREAYFAWSVNPRTGRQNSAGSCLRPIGGAMIRASIITPRPGESWMPCGARTGHRASATSSTWNIS